MQATHRRGNRVAIPLADVLFSTRFHNESFPRRFLRSPLVTPPSQPRTSRRRGCIGQNKDPTNWSVPRCGAWCDVSRGVPCYYHLFGGHQSLAVKTRTGLHGQRLHRYRTSTVTSNKGDGQLVLEGRTTQDIGGAPVDGQRHVLSYYNKTKRN